MKGNRYLPQNQLSIKDKSSNLKLCLLKNSVVPVFAWSRAREESEQHVVDTHTLDGAAHQRQQLDPHPAGHLQAAQPGLPEPVVK